jgi:hypothetical protein
VAAQPGVVEPPKSALRGVTSAGRAAFAGVAEPGLLPASFSLDAPASRAAARELASSLAGTAGFGAAASEAPRAEFAESSAPAGAAD